MNRSHNPATSAQALACSTGLAILLAGVVLGAAAWSEAAAIETGVKVVSSPAIPSSAPLYTGKPAASFKVVKLGGGTVPAQPFTPATAPIQLQVPAKRIPAWKQDSLGLVGKLQPSPVKSDQPLETVTLLPMGAARLRITSFPMIGEGNDARDWKAGE